MAKFIFVTGGVISSVGKGIAAASIGRILKEHGIAVAIQKLDPYINVDPGTMSPYQHGEVFVTEDGAETDLDLGHYERFLGINLHRVCSVTAGQIYAKVIEQERLGSYLGGTIQVVPHITNAIIESIETAAMQTACDVLIVEVGGTVGDIESAPFLEAIRQLSLKKPKTDTMFVHVPWLVHVQSTGELKTKPAQHSMSQLRSLGIIPDIVLARADQPIARYLCDKLALFAPVPSDAVFPVPTAKNYYAVPYALHEAGLTRVLSDHLQLSLALLPQSWHAWNALIEQVERPVQRTIIVGIVGKYVELNDAYMSVKEALVHAGYQFSCAVRIKWIHAEEVTDSSVAFLLDDCDGIVVPGGFDHRAIEGKIVAARWARTQQKPYLGLCLGMQVMCIELARAVIDAKAHTVE